jgi:hypothetical protein
VFAILMTLMQEAKAAEATAPKTTEKAESTAAKQSDQCQATTKSGKRCRNRAVEGNNFCHIHNK